MVRPQPHHSKSAEFVQKAATLRDHFIKCAQEGNAEICTYAWAYRHLFNGSYSKWSQAYAKKVLSVATITPPAELAGLGEVRLDAFIVSSNTSLPGYGHWESAAYIREDWERVSGHCKYYSLKRKIAAVNEAELTRKRERYRRNER